MKLREQVENNLVLWTLGLLFFGFVSGIGAYKTMLGITNQVTVVKDTYIKKSELVGSILKTEVISELDHLIETGEAINAESRNEAGIFLARTRSFLIGLNLPKDAEYQTTMMSQPVLDHQMIMMRNSWYGHEDITLSEQVSRVLGLLRGLRSSYRARAGDI